jgi:hypothetical protein
VPASQAAPLFTPPPVLRRQADPAPRPAPAAAPPKAPARAANAPAAAHRAPAPPAAFASPVETLFGEDLISERSLDEVILSYLAEDVGGRK